MKKIDRDLDSINQTIAREIRALSDSTESDLVLWREGESRRAIIALEAARDSARDFERTAPLAVALELLQLGAAKHFGPGRPAEAYGLPKANIALVTADAYYARALTLVVSLNDDRLVKILCAALSLVSEGYANPDQPGADAKKDAFAAAAQTADDIPNELLKELDNAVFPHPS